MGLRLCTAVFWVALCCALALPAFAADPVGLWLVENEEAHIEIRRCGDELCGTIAWMKEPQTEDGRTKTDIYNPDESLRDRPIVGLTILTGLPSAPDEEGVRDGGKIYDPQRGQSFKCTLRMESDDAIELHAYLGIPLLGRTTRWTRLPSDDPPPVTTGE
jgi:uncharacterized protein (DUF2147 family)